MGEGGLVRLDLNECPYPSPEAVVNRVREAALLVNRYDSVGLRRLLMELLADYVGMEPEYIIYYLVLSRSCCTALFTSGVKAFTWSHPHQRLSLHLSILS